MQIVAREALGGAQLSRFLLLNHETHLNRWVASWHIQGSQQIGVFVARVELFSQFK